MNASDLAWWKQRAVRRYAELRKARADLDRRDATLARVAKLLQAWEASDIDAAVELRRALEGR